MFGVEPDTSVDRLVLIAAKGFLLWYYSVPVERSIETSSWFTKLIIPSVSQVIILN